jgi:hypothetical protein
MKLAIGVTVIAAALWALSNCAMAHDICAGMTDPALCRKEMAERQQYFKKCAHKPASCYGKTNQDFFDALDRYQIFRTVEEYHRIVPYKDDIGGFCRKAEHIRACLVAMRQMLARIPDNPSPRPRDPEADALNKIIMEEERGDAAPIPAPAPKSYDPSYDPNKRTIAGGQQ